MSLGILQWKRLKIVLQYIVEVMITNRVSCFSRHTELQLIHDLSFTQHPLPPTHTDMYTHKQRFQHDFAGNDGHSVPMQTWQSRPNISCFRAASLSPSCNLIVFIDIQLCQRGTCRVLIYIHTTSSVLWSEDLALITGLRRIHLFYCTQWTA